MRAALDPGKFRDPQRTARGEPRANVALGALRTLWFNTGTLCNLACRSCYIGSSPRLARSLHAGGARGGARRTVPGADARWPDVAVARGFAVDVAGRDLRGEGEWALRAGYARLFAALEVPIDAADPVRLMLFPQLDATADGHGLHAAGP